MNNLLKLKRIRPDSDFEIKEDKTAKLPESALDRASIALESRSWFCCVEEYIGWT